MVDQEMTQSQNDTIRQIDQNQDKDTQVQKQEYSKVNQTSLLWQQFGIFHDERYNEFQLICMHKNKDTA